MLFRSIYLFPSHDISSSCITTKPTVVLTDQSEVLPILQQSKDTNKSCVWAKHVEIEPLNWNDYSIQEVKSNLDKAEISPQKHDDKNNHLHSSKPFHLIIGADIIYK